MHSHERPQGSEPLAQRGVAEAAARTYPLDWRSGFGLTREHDDLLRRNRLAFMSIVLHRDGLHFAQLGTARGAARPLAVSLLGLFQVAVSQLLLRLKGFAFNFASLKREIIAPDFVAPFPIGTGIV